MKPIQLRITISLLFIFFFSAVAVHAQDKKVSAADQVLKDSIYNKNRVKVLNFSLKQFDALFFEFSGKKSDPNLILTKEEFYTYTMQIATFSERLAALYPDQKEVAAENKKKWFAENYEDYLLSKASQKK